MIDEKTVQYIADLARLRLEPQQSGRMCAELQDILGYIDQLRMLDVEGVSPTSHVLDRENVFRPDEVRESLSLPQAMSFAVDHVRGHYRVPKVIE